MDIHVENPMKPVDELGITGEKRRSQKEKRNGNRKKCRSNEMAKLENYVELARQTMREISADGENWHAFLTTASNTTLNLKDIQMCQNML